MGFFWRFALNWFGFVFICPWLAITSCWVLVTFTCVSVSLSLLMFLYAAFCFLCSVGFGVLELPCLSVSSVLGMAAFPLCPPFSHRGGALWVGWDYCFALCAVLGAADREICFASRS